jgi:hypothetical protein
MTYKEQIDWFFSEAETFERIILLKMDWGYSGFEEGEDYKKVIETVAVNGHSLGKYELGDKDEFGNSLMPIGEEYTCFLRRQGGAEAIEPLMTCTYKEIAEKAIQYTAKDICMFMKWNEKKEHND